MRYIGVPCLHHVYIQVYIAQTHRRALKSAQTLQLVAKQP